MREGDNSDTPFHLQPEITLKYSDRPEPITKSESAPVSLREENARCLETMLTTEDEGVRLAMRNRLIAMNQRLIGSVAKSFAHSGVPVPELMSEGQIGLFEAIRDCRLDKVGGFSAYAVFFIRRAMVTYLYSRSTQVLNEGAKYRLARIKRVVGEMLHERGLSGEDAAKAAGVLSDREIANRANVHEGTVRNLRPYFNGSVSFDHPADENGDADSPPSISNILATDSPSPSDIVAEEDEKARAIADLELALHCLIPSHAEVVRLHFGLSGHKPLSLAEVAELRGVSWQRIQKILKASMIRLKEEMQKKATRDAARCDQVRRNANG